MSHLDELVQPLLGSEYRRNLWEHTKDTLRKLKAVLPITEVHVLGSFVTEKTRPADVDLIILVKTPKVTDDWSVDFVLAPDTQHGEAVLQDAVLWMKEKYGGSHSAIRLPVQSLEDT